jgi:hypothetical protein
MCELLSADAVRSHVLSYEIVLVTLHAPYVHPESFTSAQLLTSRLIVLQNNLINIKLFLNCCTAAVVGTVEVKAAMHALAVK